ncbi:MAG: sigma-70 family RNA polymerase sigma factor [Opitutus sp.]
MDTLDDLELVRLFQGGDATAFDEIVRRHRAMIYSAAHCVVRNARDAEEIAQETIVSAWRHLAAFRCQCKLRTWLFYISRRFALKRLRSSGYKLRGFLPLDAMAGARISFADFIASNDPLPGEELETAEMVDKVRAGMTLLSEEHRAVLTLRIVHEATYDQIATERSIPCGTVKSKISRARQSLRRKVSQEAFA